MKTKHLLLLFSLPLILTGCGTLVGGSRYNAHVNINNTNASNKTLIKYQGKVVGSDKAIFKAKRAQVTSFSFTVEKEGCKPQTYDFNDRTLRWFPIVMGIPISAQTTKNNFTGQTETKLVVGIPLGLLIDVATGSLFKPKLGQKGLYKIDYDNYRYVVDYTGCETKSDAPIKTNASPKPNLSNDSLNTIPLDIIDINE